MDDSNIQNPVKSIHNPDRGNAPDLWAKLITSLDEKLQLGLLTKIRNVAAYHIETNTLFIEPGSVEDEKYFAKDAVIQQLKLFAGDTMNVTEVKIKPRSL